MAQGAPNYRQGPGGIKSMEEEIASRQPYSLEELAKDITIEEAAAIDRHQLAMDIKNVIFTPFPLAIEKSGNIAGLEKLEKNTAQYDDDGEELIYDDALLRKLVDRTDLPADERSRAIRIRHSLVAVIFHYFDQMTTKQVSDATEVAEEIYANAKHELGIDEPELLDRTG